MSYKWTWAWVVGCAGMAGLATAMAAPDSDPADANPYTVISDRNIFHLNPPPPPAPAGDEKPADLPKVMLTGIIKKRDSLEVCLAIPPKDNKENIVYLSLAPGEKGHNVELVKVRYDKGEVDIINAGTPQTLSAKSNSYASLATAAAPAAHAAGGGASGMPPFGHRGAGGPMRNSLPPSPGHSADMTPRGGSAIIAGGGGGSAIVAGGAGGGNASSPFGSLGMSSGTGGVSISGGASSYVPTGAAATANTAGEQIATSLFNQQTGHYQVPTPVAPPAPPMVQATGLLAQKMAMGGTAPPLPPALQSMLDGAGDQGPPSPP